MSKAIVSSLLILAAFALLSLVFGASYLETTLPGGLPIGNALAAIVLCAAAGSAVGLSARRTALRRLSVISLVGAVAWLPLSIALAGNLNLNFHGDNGVIWLTLSAVIAAIVLCALIWALVSILLRLLRKNA